MAASGTTTWKRVAALLAPEPPRRLPAQRAVGVALRTVHITAFSILLGGHAFDVDRARLLPFLLGTVLSGAALVALELLSTVAWLRTNAGIIVVVKLVILLAAPIFPEHRFPILVAVVVLASVGSHVPRRFRHARLF